ncbi:sugar transferase [Pseudomonas panipatensis]|uniref:Sugar transferase involved in LPS biosynthesis (Colanic, teichoic acid) n=1 Tax=Pseudomonas panipatensis TaxID=428992 RepID=A0A1G8LI61_9PSED|nr:sugar transferase [Pseudomonas panipatensis]SDI55356.1 Sugar transferase involved in LPS biosynthesis (colanic, teichoic acid) [Pseudomonas panipatensis]SMP74848.1 Sugar transferase involved in LPS biosynthesis (colanic, teichoic acid) [Pseudomonas panipatensis]
MNAERRGRRLLLIGDGLSPALRQWLRSGVERGAVVVAQRPVREALEWLRSDPRRKQVDELVVAADQLDASTRLQLLALIGRRRLCLVRAEGPAPESFKPASERGKRLFDAAASLLLLTLLGPLLLLIALAIRLSDGAPVLFRQRRLGRQGRPFSLYKFRTLRASACADPLAPQVIAGDPRVTRLGALLRRWGLDELPQLWNVLRGDMSLVGPRPHAIAHDLLYAGLLDGYAARLAGRPGITGLAQVLGWRGEIAELEDMRERLLADLSYWRRRSLLLDLRLLLGTPLALCRARKPSARRSRRLRRRALVERSPVDLDRR